MHEMRCHPTQKAAAGSFTNSQSHISDGQTLDAHSMEIDIMSESTPPKQFEQTNKPDLRVQIPEVAFRNLSLNSPSPLRLQISPNTSAAARSAPFNLFEALLQCDEIILYLTTKMLPPKDLLNLYAISKSFHYKVNLYQSAYILSAARAWISVDDPCPTAPLSLSLPPRFLTMRRTETGQTVKALKVPQVLPFGPFLRCCHRDPTDKQLEDPPEMMQALLFDSPGRGVPNFRYLGFLVKEIAAASAVIRMLWTDFGLRLPANSLRTMGKLALIMHSRRSSVRLSLLHNEDWFTDADIFRANTIFMKLDMAFTDPLQRLRPAVKRTDSLGNCAKGTGRGMRQLMFAQPGWTVCARILAHQEGFKTKQDFMRLWAEWQFAPEQPNFGNEPVWGLDPDQLGRLRSEEIRDEYGRRVRGERKLVSVEELVIKEGIRRDLNMQEWLVEMMVCGFVDPVTGETLDGPDEVTDTC